ncbi:MAG: S8 family serine peptidase [Chloroflexota bacterium]
MAKDRVTRDNWQIRSLTLFLVLLTLILTPLSLAGANLSMPATLLLPTPAALRGQLSTTSPYNSNPAPLPGEIIVRFKSAYSAALYQALATANSFNLISQESLIGASLEAPALYQALPELAEFFRSYKVEMADAIMAERGTYLLKLDASFEPRATALKFAGSGFFDYAEPNFPVYALREPNDPLYRGQQWGLRYIKAPDTWDITTGTDNVVIAIVDSGVLTTHPDLADKVLKGMNFSAEPANANPTDNNGHGTYVAGIAAANTNNNIGMAGVAWNVKILPIKVLNADGVGSNATIAQGINYAAQKQAQIINISVGGPDRSRVVEEAVQMAFGQGEVLVASVGNSGNNLPNYPAACEGVIGVGAFNQRGEAASFSNYGPELSITAPGTSIIGPWIGSPAYITDSGSSSAAPFVSGGVALMLSVNRNLTNIQIRNILEATADSSKPNDNATTATATPSVRVSNLTGNYDLRLGWGRLNLLRAVQAAQRGDFYPAQRGLIQGTIMGLDPLDVLLTLEPGDSRIPTANGFYSFGNLPPGDYTLKVESKKYGIIEDPNTFRIRGFDGETYSFDYDLTQAVKEAFEGGSPVGAFKPHALVLPNTATRRFFPSTGQVVKDKFLKFWLDNGDLALFGYPLSEEFIENGWQVQYFERAVFEYHPEYAGTKDEIQLRLLGSERIKNLTGKAFEPVLPPALQFSEGKLISPYYFYETKHSLRGQFLDYWKANGDLAILGLPLSEELLENGYRVQYFERYRLEIHPENSGTPWEITGALLARDSAAARGLLGSDL